MEVSYVPDDEFVAIVKQLNAELRNVDGHMRWVFKRNDGTEYIIRPESGRNQDDK